VIVFLVNKHWRESRRTLRLPSDFLGIVLGRRPFNPKFRCGGNHCVYLLTSHFQLCAQPPLPFLLYPCPPLAAAMASSSEPTETNTTARKGEPRRHGGPASIPAKRRTRRELVEPLVLLKVVPLNEYWTTLMTSEANLQTLIETGLFPEGYKWTATQGQSNLTPDTFQITTFVTHCECGFGVPPSRFLERVCRHY
jgi:hypothetical protein